MSNITKREPFSKEGISKRINLRILQNSGKILLLNFFEDADNLEITAGNLRELSTTGGAGGVLDIFYAHWKLKICEHPNVFSVISQLWNATWSSGTDNLYPHPHGQFDPKRGHFYINRVCFRVPDHIAKTHKVTL